MADWSEIDFLGTGQFVFFFGVVEDTADPLQIGRMKVRCFGFHTESQSEIPTQDLPWAILLQDGATMSPTQIPNGSIVVGFFADGRAAQYPVVWGVMPKVNRPSGKNPGNSTKPYTSGPPYHGQPVERGKPGDPPASAKEPSSMPPSQGAPGAGAQTGDNNIYIGHAQASNWPLKKYSPKELQCRGTETLHLHLASGLALDAIPGKLKINSGYRSPQYNEQLRREGKGAAKDSYHTMGRAFDIGGGTIETAIQAFKAGFTGFGMYRTFLHIDTRPSGVVYRDDKGGLKAALMKAGWRDGCRPFANSRTSPGQQPAANTSSSGTDKGSSDATDLSSSSAKDDATTSDKDSGVVEPGSIDGTSREANRQGFIDEGRARGYTDAQLSGILAAIKRESNFNPFDTTGDNGISWGQAQWNGSRLTALQNFAAQNGTSWNDSATQIIFFYNELETTERSAGNMLRAAQTPTEAAAAMGAFERYRGWESVNKDAWSANQIFNNDLKGGTSGYNNPNSSGNGTGFKDPSNSQPYGQDKGKPSTPDSARGMNNNLPATRSNQGGGRVNGIPATGGRTFGEPQNPKSPQYPYNQVWQGRSGGKIEIDSTPGVERLNFEHKSGSQFQINHKGSVIQKGQNIYTTAMKNQFNSALGDYHLSSRGSMGIRSTSDVSIDADGSYEVQSHNDHKMTVAGKYDVSAGDVGQIRVKKLLIHADGGIHLKSLGDLNLEGAEAVNIKGKSINLQSTGGDIGLKASSEIAMEGTQLGITAQTKLKGLLETSGNIISGGNHIAADHQNGGGAVSPKKPKGAADADTVDIAAPGPRKKVEKDEGAGEHPDAIDGDSPYGNKDNDGQSVFDTGANPIENLPPNNEGARNTIDNIPYDGRQAADRYNNPGAQWPNQRAELYGMTGYGVLADGNRIANFPDPVYGAASNMDLLLNGNNYGDGSTIGDINYTWSGHHRDSLPGWDSNMVVTEAMLEDRNFMVPFMQSMATAEGRNYLTLDQWNQAFDVYMAINNRYPVQ